MRNNVSCDKSVFVNNIKYLLTASGNCITRQLEIRTIKLNEDRNLLKWSGGASFFFYPDATFIGIHDTGTNHLSAIASSEILSPCAGVSSRPLKYR